jgi:hypothetical protein
VARRFRRLLEHQTLRPEAMPAGVTFEPLARRAAADFPAGRIVPAGSTPHHHPLALEVKHRVVPAHAAEHLSELRDCPIHQSADRLRFHSRRCRELLGVVGNHFCNHPFCL